MKKSLVFVSVLVAALCSVNAAQTKRLLLVTTTVGFRHAAVPVQEQMIREMAKATGEFTVVSTSDSPNFPAAEYTATVDARNARIPRDGAPDNRLSAAQVRERAAAAAAGAAAPARAGGPGNAGAGRGGARRGGGPGGAPGGAASVNEKVAAVLKEYLSPESLKNYDAVAFLSTTGELPLPDADAFFAWVAEGHGFIGFHSATDTLHANPEYIKLIGAEFAGHGAHSEVAVVNLDPRSPLTAGWPAGLTITEEWYNFRNYDRSQVHALLAMETHPTNGTPGHYPVSWIKPYGKGRVFYTSMGHRDDVIDPAADIGDQEFKVRYNPPATAQAVRRHILSGVRWALGLATADMTVGSR
jgi:type 1 glutamine amidotransferase